MSLFGDRLKELRGAESMASFASGLGINRIQYFKYESGKNLPSVEILANICKAHAVSADWLLGIDPNNRGVTVHAGDGAAVAVGTNARAKAKSLAPRNNCKDCPYKKKLAALQKMITK